MILSDVTEVNRKVNRKCTFLLMIGSISVVAMVTLNFPFTFMISHRIIIVTLLHTDSYKVALLCNLQLTYRCKQSTYVHLWVITS